MDQSKYKSWFVTAAAVLGVILTIASWPDLVSVYETYFLQYLSRAAKFLGITIDSKLMNVLAFVIAILIITVLVQLAKSLARVVDEKKRTHRSSREHYLSFFLNDVENRRESSIAHARFIDLSSIEKTTFSEEKIRYVESAYFRYEDSGDVEKDILGAFQKHRRLLLLGSPGSGKTTVLLDIAQRLATLAIDDDDALIPVRLNLSSWNNKGSIESDLTRLLNKDYRSIARNSESRSICAWIATSLRNLRGVDQRWETTLDWILNNKVILLLDGLDEASEAVRAELVGVLNGFMQDNGDIQILICSRKADYESLVKNKETSLYLNTTLIIQSFDDEQIEQYLNAAEVPALNTILEKDKDLKELARTPLFLSIMVLATPELVKTHNEWHKEKSNVLRRMRLFDAYVEAVTQRRERRKKKNPQLPETDLAGHKKLETEYSIPQIRTYLGWLARKASEKSITTFQLGKLYELIKKPQLNTSPWYANITVTYLAQTLLFSIFFLALFVVYLQSEYDWVQTIVIASLGLVAFFVLQFLGLWFYAEFPDLSFEFYAFGKRKRLKLLKEFGKTVAICTFLSLIITLPFYYLKVVLDVLIPWSFAGWVVLGAALFLNLWEIDWKTIQLGISSFVSLNRFKVTVMVLIITLMVLNYLFAGVMSVGWLLIGLIYFSILSGYTGIKSIAALEYVLILCCTIIFWVNIYLFVLLYTYEPFSFFIMLFILFAGICNIILINEPLSELVSVSFLSVALVCLIGILASPEYIHIAVIVSVIAATLFFTLGSQYNSRLVIRMLNACAFLTVSVLRKLPVYKRRFVVYAGEAVLLSRSPEGIAFVHRLLRDYFAIRGVLDSYDFYSSSDRVALTKELVGVKDASCDVLLELSDDRDKSVRLACIEGLGDIGTSIAAQTLLSIIQDTTGHIQEKAILALSEVKDIAALGLMQNIIQSSSIEDPVCIAAISSITRMQKVESLESSGVMDTLRGDKKILNSKYFTADQSLVISAMVRVLLEKDVLTNADTHYYSEKYLSYLGDSGVKDLITKKISYKQLVHEITHGTEEEKVHAWRLISILYGGKMDTVARGVLSRKDPVLRDSAVVALGHSEKKRHRKIIKRQLDSQESENILVALDALMRINSRRDRAVYISFFDHTDERVRSKVIHHVILHSKLRHTFDENNKAYDPDLFNKYAHYFLNDASVDIRILALNIIAERKLTHYEREVVDALSDETEDIKTVALETLIELKSTPVRKEVEELVRSQNDRLKKAAICYCLHANPSTTFEKIIELVKTEEKPILGQIIDVLPEKKQKSRMIALLLDDNDPGVLQNLISLWEDRSSLFYFQDYEKLLRHPGIRILPYKDQMRFLRNIAAVSAKLIDETAEINYTLIKIEIHRIIKLFFALGWSVREKLLIRLVRHKSTHLLFPLEKLFNSDIDAVYEKPDPVESMDVMYKFIGYLQHDDPNIRYVAVFTLGLIGDSEAVHPISTLLGDHSGIEPDILEETSKVVNVHMGAVNALELIGTKEAKEKLETFRGRIN